MAGLRKWFEELEQYAAADGWSGLDVFEWAEFWRRGLSPQQTWDEHKDD